MIRTVPPPLEILYGGGVALACGHGGQIEADELHGMFARDTRVLSTYRLAIGGHAWRVLARSRPGPSTAQWDLQNPILRTPGGDLAEGSVHCRLRRRVFGALHDDVTVTSFAERAIALRLSFIVDADFADVFQVKAQSTPARLAVERVPNARTLRLAYQRGGFQRGLRVTFETTAGVPSFVGAQVVFDVTLEPGTPWQCCLDASPELDGERLAFEGDPHAVDVSPPGEPRAAITCAPLLRDPFERGCRDLERLAIDQDGTRFIAAGAPWFMALFGRDTLVTSLMAGVLGPWPVDGALSALGRHQSRVRDDFRDAQPGKIAHELRRGELARFGVVPHTPYYGSHDAPALYVLALWNAFRWTGDGDLLRRHLPAAEAALGWCDELGDADRDGFLEYRTRSKKGYWNQGWKDAGDAILYEDGTIVEPPIATVELQGYWYAARLAMAELLDATGERGRGDTCRLAARELRRLVEGRLWMEAEGCYALALDGRKRLVPSVASNSGHLLWCGLPTAERAARVARRLMADDMFSGYGVRTLSTRHRRYNPLSYQLGAVWPHDSALFAAGLARYGLRDDAARVLRGILDAAATFEQSRLPELFCGFPRDDGPPVPYEKANVPQAWAAAVPLLAAQIFLGLLPDAGNKRCFLSPWLPDWLPRLELTGIEIGDGRLDVAIARHGDETRLENAKHPSIEILIGAPEAPLWGAPAVSVTARGAANTP
jgi:glycogen debranching enzyme